MGKVTRSDLMGVLPHMMAFEEDPDYRSSQEFLAPYGKGLMTGEGIPDYFAPIGELGGSEFEKMLDQILGDTEEGVYGAAARAGVRSERLPSIMSREKGRISTEARFKDYMRMLEGRKWILGEGRGITEGVRGAGLTTQGQKMSMKQSQAQMYMGLGESQIQQDFLEKEAQKQRDADFWESIIGGAGTVAGMAMLGPLGAAGGGMLGSAAGGGNTIGGGMTAGGWLEPLQMPGL